MGHYSLAPANFADYRDFLRGRFSELQEKNKKFSLQVCASKAKISKSLLQFLFNKKRHISLDKLPDLARGLKLTADEEYFVYLMLCKSSSRHQAVREHFEKILGRIRHQYVKTDADEPTSSSRESDKTLYLNPLFMILQTLVRLPDFKEDDKWIANRLALPELNIEKIKEGLSKLEALGFITRDASGKLTAKPDSLWRPDPYDPSGQSVYTAGARMLAELMRAPDLYKPSVFMSMCLAFDEERLLAVEKLMIECHHKLAALSKESKHPTAVAFIGNYFLTVARGVS